MNNLTMPASGEISIPINAHLQRVQYVLLVVFIAIAATLYWFLGSSPYLLPWLTSPTLWIGYGLFCAGILVNAHVNKQKKVVFSAPDQAVYYQTVFGRKRLMAFADVGAIKPYDSSVQGTYFALFGRENLFQRSPPRISPAYTTAKKSEALYHQFEQTVLPQLRAMVSRSQLPESGKQALEPNKLVYYQPEGGIFRLINVYHRRAESYAVIAGLTLIALWILFDSSVRLSLFNYGIGSGIAALLLAFLQTEKHYFQSGQFVSEYSGGLFRKTYPVAQFASYQITHRRHNFIYVGTDVNLVFWVADKPKAVFLCQVKKTETIDGLIRETDYIMDRKGAEQAM